MASGPDGSLYIAWRKIYPADSGQLEIRDIAVARSTDDGKSWSAPTRVHADDWHVNYCPEAGPSLAVGNDGRVHVAWWTGKPGDAGVHYAVSADNGGTFAAPVPLGVANASRASHVQLALGSGSDSAVVIAAWDDGTLAVPQIVTRLSRDGGATFGQAVAHSAPGQAAGYPVVNLRADTVMVAWQQRGNPAEASAAEHAPMTDAASMIHSVGSLFVVTRAGTLSR
jgi:hypothetical protein